MLRGLRISASAAALTLLIGAGISTSQAADVEVVDPGCTFSGSVMAGYMHDWQNAEASDAGEDFDGKDVDWDTPFGEGAGLLTCGGFNFQADAAVYAHSGEVDLDDDAPDFLDDEIDQTNAHIGGALFYRDPGSWAGGLQASWIFQDLEFSDSDSFDIDIFRIGLFGEFYLNEMVTLGGSAAYYSADWPNFTGLDEDGFELAAWGRFYATPDLALTLRGDVLLGDLDSDFSGSADLDGFAITGDAEYLVWDEGLSVFAGARYAERELDPQDDEFGDVTIEDFQVFAGLKFHFGQEGTLAERQRTGPVDNTSVFFEKLPNFFSSQSLAFPSVN